jgi:hypothetical protein
LEELLAITDPAIIVPAAPMVWAIKPVAITARLMAPVQVAALSVMVLNKAAPLALAPDPEL